MPGSNAGDNAGSVIALAVIARHATQDGVHRLVQRLAFDVPQGQVERAQGMHLLAARRVEESPRHILPQLFDILRIASDQPSGALLQRVLGTAFTDSGDAGIGLHQDHQVALVEEWIRIGRRENANFGDLHLWHGRASVRQRADGGSRADGQGSDEGSSIHGGSSWCDSFTLLHLKFTCGRVVRSGTDHRCSWSVRAWPGQPLDRRQETIVCPTWFHAPAHGVV